MIQTVSACKGYFGTDLAATKCLDYKGSAMKQIKVLRDIFNIWPDLHAMGKALGEEAGTVKQWRTRGKIPERAFGALMLAADARGFQLEWMQLQKLNPPRKDRYGKRVKKVRAKK